MSDVEVQPSEEGSVFLTHLFGFPLVTSAISYSTQTYQHYKQAIPLANATMSVTENAIGFVVSKSKPLLNILHKPFSVADNLGAKALELIETKVPAITRPTNQIVEESKEYLNELRTRTLGKIVLSVDSRIKVGQKLYERLARINAMIEQLKPSALPNLVQISSRSEKLFLEVTDNAKPQVLLNYVHVYKNRLLWRIDTFLFSIHLLGKHVILLAERLRVQESPLLSLTNFQEIFDINYINKHLHVL